MIFVHRILRLIMVCCFSFIIIVKFKTKLINDLKVARFTRIILLYYTIASVIRGCTLCKL